MKRSLKTTRYLGFLIGVAAIYFSFKNIEWKRFYYSLSTMKLTWLAVILGINFIVISLKTLRWQSMIHPVKKTRFTKVFQILTIGFTANNIFPARFGEFLRVYLLGKNELVNRTAIAATLVADRIIEALSLVVIAVSLLYFHTIPIWMKKGVAITAIIVLTAYLIAVILTRKRIADAWAARSRNRLARVVSRLTDGLRALMSPRLFAVALSTSLLSWLMQAAMIYLIQISFGVYLPLWNLVLVLVAVNLAIAIPSAPSNIGTFEFACVLAYTQLGLDKSTALLLGLSYHLLQILPVTAAGVIIFLSNRISLTQADLLEPCKTYSKTEVE